MSQSLMRNIGVALRGLSLSAPASALLASALLVSSAQAANPTTRFALTSAQVVAALEARKLPTEGIQLSLAVAMTSTVEAPQLELQSMSPIDHTSARLRIACKVHAECMPFLVTASWPDAVPAVPEALTHTAAPRHTEAAAGDSAAASGLRAGTPATLLIDDGKIHIRMQVRTLQAGDTGDKVRVSSTDHKSYVGEVVSPTLLKGIL
jgi:hypothetical protein